MPYVPTNQVWSNHASEVMSRSCQLTDRPKYSKYCGSSSLLGFQAEDASPLLVSRKAVFHGAAHTG